MQFELDNEFAQITVQVSSEESSMIRIHDVSLNLRNLECNVYELINRINEAFKFFQMHAG